MFFAVSTAALFLIGTVEKGTGVLLTIIIVGCILFVYIVGAPSFPADMLFTILTFVLFMGAVYC